MGTYGYISIIAMVCYAFMLLMFLAAKRNKIVNSFLVVLTGLLLWTGGSAFMRAQLWPQYEFWYQVSLFGILLLPYAYYRFILAFGGQAGSRYKAFHAVFQLDEQAALGHAGDAALVALAQMAACILGLVAVLGLALDLHGDDFALAGLLADVLGKLAVTQDHGVLVRDRKSTRLNSSHPSSSRMPSSA